MLVGIAVVDDEGVALALVAMVGALVGAEVAAADELIAPPMPPIVGAVVGAALEAGPAADVAAPPVVAAALTDAATVGVVFTPVELAVGVPLLPSEFPQA